MAKTYVCDTCKLTVTGADAYRVHRDGAAHLAAEQRARETEIALAWWATSRRPAVTGNYRETAVVLAAQTGGTERQAFGLLESVRQMESDMAELDRELVRMGEEVEQGLAKLRARGAAGLYSTTLVSGHRVAEIAQLQGKVLAQRETLKWSLDAAGLRCALLREPADWAVLEALAQFTVESPAFTTWTLVAGGERTMGFETEGAAVLEAFNRAQAMARQPVAVLGR